MPTRYLKPGIRDSEAIDSLSPLAETLFYRLLVTVDDFGRYDARPTMVKAHCFPIKDMTSAKCAALLDELHSAGLVNIYTADGKPYLQICKWDNVPRASASKYPAHVYDCAQMHTSVCKPRTVVPLTVTVTGTETVTGTKTETETETKTGNRNRRAPNGASDCPPEGLDLEAWSRWLDYRKGIGKPLKPVSIAAAQKALAGHGANQSGVVEQSIVNGWQGLFELKQAGHTGQPNKQEAVEKRNQAALEAWLESERIKDEA